jgi:hypothetical protein
MADDSNQTERIAALNDEAGRAAGLTRTGRAAVPGRCFVTAGVMALIRDGPVAGKEGRLWWVVHLE